MPGERPPTICFSGFTLDLPRGHLRHGDAEVKLRPKSFDVLRYLVENSGRLVSKDELIHAVWPETFVTDNSLVQCLIEVRRALGDEAQTLIRTVPRRGYIFDVPVTTAEQPEAADTRPIMAAPRGTPSEIASRPTQEPAVEAPAGIRPPPETSTRPGRSIYLVGVAGVIAAVVAVGTFEVGQLRSSLFTRQTARGIRSIAVLPLEGLSREGEFDYFADGITDALTTSLAQIDAVRVISRTTAMQYKKTRKSLPQIAQELDVDVVLEGTALRSGDKVRISAQLVMAREDKHLWAKSYEGAMENVLQLQDDVARDVATEMRVRLPRDKALGAPTPSMRPEAYEAYVRSRQFILASQRTADSARKSNDYARQALARQPDSALLLANLADSLITMNLLGGGAAQNVMPEAKDAAEGALRIDDSIGIAHYVLAMVHFNYDWDFRAAEREFARALQLEPNAAETHSFHGFYLSAMGRHDDAIAEMRRGLELDPLSLLQNRNVGSALYYARRYDEAVAQFLHTAALDPAYPVVYNWLSWTFQAQHMDAPAAAWALKEMEANRASPAVLADVRARMAVDGPRGFWEATLTRGATVPLAQMPGPLAYQFAAAAVQLRRPQKAIEYLQRALDDRAYWIPFVSVDPRFDDLHADPRFKALLDRIGLDHLS